MSTRIFVVVPLIFSIYCSTSSISYDRNALDKLKKTNKCEGCNLRGANLEGNFLSASKLSRADLSGAILKRSDLLQADLRGAILKNADLRNAHLRQAQLDGTDLTGANLANAVVSRKWKKYIKKAGVIGFDKIRWVE